MEEDRKNATRIFNEQCESLEISLSEYEKQIIKVCKAPLPRDVEALQSLIITHKQFEHDVQAKEPEINQVSSRPFRQS